jgi:hypothetical protein
MDSLYYVDEDADANAVKEAIKFVAEFVNGIFHRGNILICNDRHIASHLRIGFNKPLILNLVNVGRMDILLSKTKPKHAPAPRLELEWQIESKRRLAMLTSLIIKINETWKYNTWATSAYNVYNCQEIRGLYIVECNPSYDPRHKWSDYLFVYEDVAMEYSHNNNMRLF